MNSRLELHTDDAAQLQEEPGAIAPSGTQGDVNVVQTSQVPHDSAIAQALRHEAAVASFAQCALHGDPPEELAMLAVEAAKRALDTHACIILELQPDEQHFAVRASAGIDPPPGAGIPMPLEAFPQASRTFETQQTIVVDDYVTTRPWSQLGWERASGERAGVTMLIPGGRRAYGVIAAYRTTDRSFGTDDLSFLRRLADLFARAVDRYREEQRARHAEEYYRSLIENFSEGIALNAEGKMLFVSRSFERMFGYTPAEALNTDIFFLCHPGDHSRIRETLLRIFEQPHRPEIFECRMRHKDESWRDFEITWQGTTGLAGNPIVIARLRDMTEHRLAERARELVRSNAELERFAYVASHDLKEPLRAVALYAQLLGRHLAAHEDPEVHESLRHMWQGAKRMQELIDALLQYARLAPKAPTLEPVDCAAVVEEVLGRLDDVIQSAQAEIRLEQMPTVLAERTLLAQLFQNLIGNALKFRGHEPPVIRVSARPQDREWLFAVRDNGIGIAPQYAERIFDMFERLHPSGEYPGTGMGLAICKKAVENLGGRIWVQSEPGRGSSFLFTLPAG